MSLLQKLGYRSDFVAALEWEVSALLSREAQS